VARHKDKSWNLDDKVGTWTEVQVALLMDIRDELKALVSILGCYNARDIPNILRSIKKNTTKRKYKKRTS